MTTASNIVKEWAEGRSAIDTDGGDAYGIALARMFDESTNHHYLAPDQLTKLNEPQERTIEILRYEDDSHIIYSDDGWVSEHCKELTGDSLQRILSAMS